MRIFGLVVGLVALVAISCRAAAAQARVDPPQELLVVVAVGPDQTLDGLRAFVNQVRPGMGQMLSRATIRTEAAPIVTAGSLDGLDDRAPIYLLVVDGGAALKGAAIAGKIRDDGKLAIGAVPAHLVKKSGWAVIGPKAIADKVAPFAFGTLAGQRAPTAPMATVYTHNLLDRYGAEIEQGWKQAFAAMPSTGAFANMMQSYFEGLMSALADSNRVVLTLEPTKDVITLDMAMVPTPGTRLAKFTAVQQPSDYGLVGKLPAAAQMPVVAAGHLDGGPYRAGLLEMMAQMYGSGGGKNVASSIGALLQASSGEFAMGMMGTMQALETAQVFGLTDPKAADRAIAQMIDGLGTGVTTDMMGIKMTMKAGKPVTHAGIALRGYDTTYDFSKAPPASRQTFEKTLPKGPMTTLIGLVDRLGVAGVSPRGGGTTFAAIDAVRGSGKRYVPPREIAAFFAASRARKESVAAAMDMRALGTPFAGAILMSLGFADKNLHIRIGVPVSVARGAGP